MRFMRQEGTENDGPNTVIGRYLSLPDQTWTFLFYVHLKESHIMDQSLDIFPHSRNLDDVNRLKPEPHTSYNHHEQVYRQNASNLYAFLGALCLH